MTPSAKSEEPLLPGHGVIGEIKMASNVLAVKVGDKSNNPKEARATRLLGI